jgi:uncharacterized protein YdeI (YjbR/CyaY-like superfamily)
MTNSNPKVDWYFAKAKTWKPEVEKLREIILDCDLIEDLKYGCPCYNLDGSNIVLIHTFKNYCALLFYKGALMNDPNKILIQQTENVQSARQLRFTSLAEITKLQSIIKAYVLDAIRVDQSGAKVEMKHTREYPVPAELLNAFDEQPDLKVAFDALTGGRQRGYLLYFASAKQPKTRIERIQKCTQAIFEGRGMLMSKKLEE